MYNKIILKHNRSIGFTLVELIIVISVIGVLAAIVVISYNGWNKVTNVAKIKSDLNGVSAAMEDARNFGPGYQTDVNNLTNFTKSDGVILTGGSIDGGVSYCVDASSSQFSGLDYYIDSSNYINGAQPGKCPTTQSAVIRIRIYGPDTGKVVVTDGVFTNECYKTTLTDTTKYCQYNYNYTGMGKSITSVIAYPDSSVDIPGLQWRDYWQCIVNSGPALTNNSLTTITDDTFRVNFGLHTFSCGTAVW